MKHTITSKESYHETMVAVYNLMNKGEANLTAKELKNLETMAKAAEEYENNVLGLKPAKEPQTITELLIFLETLSPMAKLDLISKLAQSLKSEVKPKENLFKSSFGAWTGNEPAEDILKGIKDSRLFNSQTEGL